MWSTAPAPARPRRTSARSPTEPTRSVVGDGRTSRPTTSTPSARRTRTSASPRCPELPVTTVVMRGAGSYDETDGDGARVASPPCRTVASSTSARRGPGGPSSSGPAPSGPRWPCCSPAAACARRSRPGRAEQAQRLTADRENRDYLPGVELPGDLRIETIDAGLGAGRPRVPRRPLPRPGRRHRRAGGGRPPRSRRGRVAGQGPGAARRHRADDHARRAPRRRARRLPRRPGPRARDGPRGRRPGGRVRLRGARRGDRAGLHARGRRLRALERPGRRRARRAWPRTPPRWPRAPPRRRASTPRAPPPATSSPRSGASPSGRARGRSR